MSTTTDQSCMGLDEALGEDVIATDEWSFLRAVALETDMSYDSEETLILMFGLAAARMNGSPNEVHPAIRDSVRRATLEGAIAALPDALACDMGLLRCLWEHMPMLEGQESYEAIAELCRKAAEIEGIQLGPVSPYAELQPVGLL